MVMRVFGSETSLDREFIRGQSFLKTKGIGANWELLDLADPWVGDSKITFLANLLMCYTEAKPSKREAWESRTLRWKNSSQGKADGNSQKVLTDE